MTNRPDHRQSHALLDLGSRANKALKIQCLLRLESRAQPFSLLEVGTGAGGIAHYFATHTSLRCEVSAVDVIDQRAVTDSFLFTLVSDTHLPFADGTFDVVLSNHVIEHVGSAPAQLHHLQEIHRVLTPGGVGYLAVPNRWMLIEPHYRPAFLSWLPRPLRTPYLRVLQRGARYDCEPLSLPVIDALLDQAGLVFEHLEIEAIHAFAAIEGAGNTGCGLLSRMPDRLLSMLRPLIPTFICRLERRPWAGLQQATST